jgi:hypothetical protein
MQIFCKLFKIQIPNYMYRYTCTSLTTVSGLVVQQNLQNCMRKWIIYKVSATQSIPQELQNRPRIFIEQRISSLHFNLVASLRVETKPCTKCRSFELFQHSCLLWDCKQLLATPVEKDPSPYKH